MLPRPPGARRTHPPPERYELLIANERIGELTKHVAKLEAANKQALARASKLDAQVAQMTALTNAPAPDSTDELATLKAKADTYIAGLRSMIAQRDATIAQLRAGMAATEPPRPMQAAVTEPPRPMQAAPTARHLPAKKATSGFAGPKKSGGVHIDGKTCSIAGHGCRLPWPR